MSPDTPQTSVRGPITVRYWAGARDAAGVTQERVPATASTLIGEVLAEVSTRHPGINVILPACSVLLDGLRVDPSAAVGDAETVELLPPFAGG